MLVIVLSLAFDSVHLKLLEQCTELSNSYYRLLTRAPASSFDHTW